MAFQKKPSIEGEDSSVNQMNVITAGTYFEGTIETKGSISILGKVKGTVKAADTVRVGRSGEVVGEVYAKIARVGGLVEGNAFIEEKITLESNSTLNGNLSAGKLIIDEGAIFNGQADMGGKKTDITANGKKGLFDKSKAEKDLQSESPRQ